MPEIHVELRGVKEAIRRLADSPAKLDQALRPAFQRASVVIEGAARDKVHKVTRKLHGSLGHKMSGYGPSLESRIGPQPGTGQPRGYSASDTRRWKKPRKGVNRGHPEYRGESDPGYAIYEEEGNRYRPGHPFLRPAVEENEERIARHILDELDRVFGR